MCAIFGWNGKMPKGLISKVLRGMESRGRDSVGVAFRVKGNDGKMQNKCYRLADSANHFVTDNEPILSDARRSTVGIAHTRRASPGMPINDRNAHPFPYWRYFFAHNGKIRNWREIKALLQSHFKTETDRLTQANDPRAKTAEYCSQFSDSITTDSMVLGPYIESRDFRSIQGCMGLVWMVGKSVYTMRFEKEAVACTIVWRYKDVALAEKETSDDEMITLVASTPEIIQKAFEQCTGVEFELGPMIEFKEGHVFRLEATGLVDEGKVPTGVGEKDKFTSESVEEPTTVTETVTEDPPVIEPEPTPDTTEKIDTQTT